MQVRDRTGRTMLVQVKPRLRLDCCGTKGHRLAEPIFVTGRMRSGTTMLASFLNAQRGIRVMSDTLRIPTASLNAFQTRVDYSTVLAASSRELLWKTFIGMVGRDETDEHHEKALVQPYLDMDVYPFFETHIDLYLRLQGELAKLLQLPPDTDYFGVKATRGESLAQGLGQRGHKAIIILRDPRAAFASTVLRARQDQFTSNDVDDFIGQWRHSYSHFVRPETGVLAIRYEDFLQDPVICERISDYLGRPIDPDVRITSKNSSFDDKMTGKRRLEPIDRWKTFDDQAAIEKIVEGLRSEMTTVGYLEPVPVPPDEPLSA